MHLRSQTVRYPFSLMTGLGLGISHPQPLEALLPAQCLGQTQLSTYVNASNGNLMIQDRPFHFKEVGTPFSIGYVYNSLVPNTNEAWRLAVSREVKSVEKEKKLTVIEADGHEVIYTYNAAKQCYLSDLSNSLTTITFDVATSTYIYAESSSNTKEVFSQAGKLSKRIDAKGNEQTFHYDATQRLASVSTASGAGYELDYQDGSTLLYKRENEKRTLLQRYLFDQQGRLTRSETDDGRGVDYHYDKSSQQLNAITGFDKTMLTFSYETPDIHARVSGVKLGEDTLFCLDKQQKTCTFTDANNVKTQLTLDDQDRLQTLLTPAGETKLSYTVDGQVKQITYPDQSTEHFAYDPENGLLTQHIARTGLVTTVIYQTIQDQVLKIAENSFDPTTNSTTTTHFVYDEQSVSGYPRLAFKVSPAGRVTEYLYDNSAGLISGLRTYSSKVFSHAPTHGNLITWKAKADLTQTTLTTFKYDLHGRATQKTTFTAVDSDGNGVVNTSMQTSDFSWDELDYIAKESTLRLATIDKGALQTAIYQQQKNTYDAWGLLTETEAAVGSAQVQKTSHRYSANKEAISYADQHNEVVVLDARGLVMQMEEVAKKAVEKINVKRDANGNITQITQEDGTQKHLVHDEVNQREYTISALGYVEETYHNSQFNYVMKKSYARPTNLQAYLQNETLNKPAFLQSLTALSDAKDRQTYTFLDADQRERFIVDALNNVIEHRYNAHGQLIMQIAYADKLSLAELDTLKEGKDLGRSLNRQVDRVTTTFYDQDQLKIAEQDAAGFITTYNYNESGHLVEKTQHSTPDTIITTDFAQLNLFTSNKDAHQYFINDAKGQCLFEIDAKGYVTAHTYYHDGKKKNTIQYANPVSSTWYENTASYPNMASHQNDRQVSYHYDDLGRLERTYGPFDQITTFAYDNMNRQIGSYVTDAKSKTISGDTSRGTEKQFDDRGCLIAEANPYLTEKLKKIDENNTLLPDQKAAAKRALWDSQSTKHEYEHHLKIKSIDALGNVTRYFYDADHRLTLTIQPNGAMSELSYNAFGEIESERHYAAFCSEEALTSLQGGKITPHLTSMLDGLKDSAKDNVIRYTRNAKGHIEHKTDAELYITSYEYNAFQECILEVHPVSHQDDTLNITHEYDNRGLEVKTQTTQAATGIDTTVTRRFDHYVGKETSVTNENGLTTTKEYDLVGQLETVTYSDSDGLSLSEQYAYDAFHRIVSVTDASKHTTTTTYKDAQHEQVVTLADGTFKTITTNIFGDAIKVENEAGNITLTTHTATGQQQTVTDMALGIKVTNHYDMLDRLEEAVDGMGVKTKHQYSKTDLVETIEDADGLKLSTKFKVNAHGKNSEVTDHNGIVTTNEFTRRGELKRQIRDKQGLKLTTENKFNAQGQKESIVQGDEKNANQYQLDLVHDGLGRETSHCIDPDIKDQKSHLAITQTTTFSASGKPTVEIDPLGDKKWHIYDSLDRKRFSIVQQSRTEACLIGWEYTETGEVKSQRLYANPIKMADFPTALTVKSLKQYTTSDEDSLTLTLHNELKQPRFTLNATWDNENKLRVFQVSEQLFDAMGNVTATIQYANVFMAAGIEPTYANLLAFSERNRNNTQNRVVRTLYNSQHKPLYHINASGQVTAFSYDLNSQPVEEREFYLPLSNLKSLHTISEKDLISQLAALPKNNAKDKVSRTGYDALKRKTYEIDAIGRVKQYRYDANNNLTHIIERAEVLSLHTDSIDDRLTSLLASKPNRSKDRIISRKYDAANRLIKEKDALGNVQEFIYDALGNQKKHIDRLGHTWEAEYDRAKRVTDKLSPEIAITEVKRNADGHLVDRQVKTKVTKHFDYDAAGNKTKIIDGKGLADERTQAFSYYAQGRLQVSLTLGALIDNASAKANLNQLPVTTSDISLAFRHDARGREIACQHENGVWSATVYNHLGQPLYKVSPEGAVTRYTYNAFGQPSEIYSYATPFKVNDAFLQSHCSRAILEAALTTHKDDRSIRCEYDADGLLTRTEKREVFFYSNGEMGYGKPQHTQRHNRHQKVWHEATLIRPNVWADTYYWYDAAGQKIGELNPNKYLTLYTYDAFGQLTGRQEYAQPIAMVPDQHASFDDLKALITPDEKDRYYRHEYDLAGNKTAELQENITVQEPAFSGHYIPGFKDVKVKACGKRFAYDAEGRLTETTHENGKKTKSFHNARGDVIAETGIPFIREDQHRTLLTLLTTYGVNAFSQVNKKTQHHANHNIAVAADAESLGFDPDDLTELSLHDKRGLVQLHQNALKKLKASTYTRSKKRAREFYATTTFIPNGKTQDLTNVAHHIDEKQFEYDAEDRTTVSRSLRDGSIMFQSHAKFNAFSDTVGEGVNGLDFPLYRKLDQNGNVLLSNAGNGALVMTLRDLSGRDSMSLSSPSIDISHPDNLNPIKLLSLDPSIVERSETHRDLCGFATHYKAPHWYYKNDNGFPTKFFVLDRWGNVVKEANAHGRTTEHEFNHQNHAISTITPETTVGNENGKQLRKRITTKNCYNLSGVLIGHIDGNGNAELYILDDANHTIEHVLGDGTRYQRNLFDIFSRNDVTIDPIGYVTRRLFDRSHQISELIFPSGLRQIFTHDGANNRNSICHQLNSIHRSLYCFNFDINRNITHLIEPLGQCSQAQFYQTGQLKRFTNPDGTYREWNKDYFGNISNHRLLCGEVRHFQLDLNKQPIAEYSTVGLHGDELLLDFYKERIVSTYHPYYLPSVKKRIVKDALHKISYIRKFSLLFETLDSYNNRDVKFDYNSLGHVESEHHIAHDRTLVKTVRSYFDELEREYATDNIILSGTQNYSRFELRRLFDAADNVRYQKSTCIPAAYYAAIPCPTITREGWNKFDAANRATHVDCVLYNGQITLGLGQGLEIYYQYGLRRNEKSMRNNGTIINAGIIHDVDSRVTGISTSDGQVTEFRLDHPMHLICLQKHGSYEHQENIDLDANFNISHTATSVNGRHESDMAYYMPANSNQPYRVIRKQWANNDWIVDDYTLHYNGFESTVPGFAVGSRDKFGPGQAAMLYHNGMINSKWNAGDEYRPGAENAWPVFYDVAPNQSLLGRHNVYDVAKPVVIIGWPMGKRMVRQIESLHTLTSITLGNIGLYKEVINDDDMRGVCAAEAYPTSSYPASRYKQPSTSMTIHSPVRSIVKDVHPSSSNSPDLIAQSSQVASPEMATRVHITQPGETIASIATGMSSKEAAKLMGDNALLTQQLKPLQVLFMHPTTPSSEFKADTQLLPFDRFMGLMTGNIAPFFPLTQIPPKDHHKKHPWWHTLVKVIAVAVIMIVAPAMAIAIAGPLLGVAATTAAVTATTFGAVTAGVLTAASAALLDAAAQGLLVGFGMQDHFSLSESVQMGVSAGMMAGPMAALQDASGFAEIAKAIGDVSLRAAEAELFNMATGVTPRFDLKNVLTQVSGALLAKGIGGVFNKVSNAIPANEGSITEHTVKLAHSAAQTLADNTLGMALNHTPISAEAMATQALGGHVGQQIGHKYVTPRFGGSDDKKVTTKSAHHSRATRSSSSTRDIHARMAQHRPQTHTPLNDPNLAEAEFLAHGSLVTDAKLDLSNEAILEARRAQLPKGYAKIHDRKDAILGMGADIFKGTPVGGLFSTIKDTRTDLRTVAYGDHDAKMVSLGHLSVDAVLIVAGVAVEAVPVLASVVSRVSIFGRRLESSGSLLFRTNPTSASLNEGLVPITDDLVKAMRNKGRSIDIALKDSDDYRYLKSMDAEGSTNTATPNHILIREDASRSTLFEEFLHGTQNRLGIVSRLSAQGAEIHVKDFMIRHAKLLGLDNPADLRLLEQLKIEEIERFNMMYK